MSDTFRLIVPAKVEEKIRYLLRKYPSTEWSGVLFTSHTGSFEQKDLVITCHDIYPMDLGNAVYTDFYMNEDVAGYMAENIDLFKYDCQLIHSHHGMSSFFSDTDTQTLREEGNDRNCFVSLIVNNAGDYSAAITRKIQRKSEVTTKSLGTSYEFFGDGEIKTDEDPMTETTKIIDEAVIEYFMLKVEREEVTNPLAWLDTRFDEITAKKQRQSPVIYKQTPNIPPFKDIEYSNLHEEEPQTNPQKELMENYLFDKKTMDELIEKPWIPDHETIHAAVVHMLTCSLILKAEGFDLKQWIAKHMDRVYTRIFNTEAWIGVNQLDNWLDFIIEFTLDSLDTYTPESQDVEIDLDEVRADIAGALYEEVEEYKDDSKYIADYLNALEKHLYY